MEPLDKKYLRLEVIGIAMKRLHIVISGDVQGVFFRQFLKSKAESLGLAGWVKNVGTNKVEAVVEGEDNALNILLSYCRQGPTGAKVGEIKFQYEPWTGEFENFKVR